MADIVAKNPADRDQSLNVSDVLKLTVREMKLAEDERAETIERVDLKEADDGWKAVTPAE